MSKKISQFQFKQFSVSHHRSAMKVGVDGVLIGCWADVGGAKRILDVGTGCGLIALLMAQRVPNAMIDAIDIDLPSIEEASENALSSPWSERIKIRQCSFSEAASLLNAGSINKEDGYDLIISNPPYFDSGVTSITTAREKARHQGELSPLSLLCGAKPLLNSGGSVAMVVPTEISGSLKQEGRLLGYTLARKCLVRGHAQAPYKRILLQWNLSDSQMLSSDSLEEYLTLNDSDGTPTEAYRSLCRDFYLRF